MRITDYLSPTLYQLHNNFAKPATAKVLSRLPFQLKKEVAERLLNKTFAQAMDDGDFDFLNDKVVALYICDLDQSLFITYSEALKVIPPPPEYQLRISGDLDEFVTLALRKEDPDTLFFQRRITIEGDTELGLAVKNLIDAVDMDELPTHIRHGLTCCNSIYPYLQPRGTR